MATRAGWSILVGLLLCAALVGTMAGLVLTYLVPRSGQRSTPLIHLVPLGLYGVTFGVHPSPATWVLSLPPLTLAAAGWLTRARTSGAMGGLPAAGGSRDGERASDALALVALAGALWTTLADLVSQYLGVALYLLGTSVLWAVAGASPAGRGAHPGHGHEHRVACRRAPPG